jgi:hypothetical protein
MALSLFAAFWFVPRDDGSARIIAIQPDRFVQTGNPSWIPMLSAWGSGIFLPLIAFFYLRNAVALDEKSGVARLVSSSPIGNARYMLGKLCSGTLILYCFAATVMLGSFFMALRHFPGRIPSAYQFLSPFAFLPTALPLCAALALLFGSVKFLRGAIGSVVYVVGVFIMYETIIENRAFPLRFFDVSGVSIVYRAIARAVLEQSGRPLEALTLMFSGNVSPAARLVFDGAALSAADIQGFFGMLCVALGITLISATLYNLSKKHEEKPSKKQRALKLPATGATAPVLGIYTPVLPSGKQTLLRGICAELRLMLSGQSFTWKLISFAALAVCLFADLGMAQTYILPLLALWFVNVFSKMGSREYRHDVLKIITVIPNGRLRQMAFSWLSGILIALALSFPVILRTVFIGRLAGALACLAGAIFLPSFSMFLGEFTKTSRALELSLTVITYAGFNNVEALSYMGTYPDLAPPLRSGVYLAIGVIMGSAAVLKRLKRD